MTSQYQNDAVHRRAQKLANQKMRTDILPLLSRTHPQPGGWNPLRPRGTNSAYGMKLGMSDALVLEILKSDTLMSKVEEIVRVSVQEAALDEPESFVTSLLSSLITDG